MKYNVSMAHKFFSADFHLGDSNLMHLEKWPFKSIEMHDEALLKSCRELAKAGDVIYHLGDLMKYGIDHHYDDPQVGQKMKQSNALEGVSAMFINIRGNHDLNNKVKSVCDSMHMFLSKRYPSVSLSHYPSYDRRLDPSCLTAPIHLCGHVHSKFRHCLDTTNHILNINVGCMAWKFRIVSDDELIAYLNLLFKRKPTDLFRAAVQPNGKVVFLPKTV